MNPEWYLKEFQIQHYRKLVRRAFRFSFVGFFWSARPSIRSRQRNQNTILHFWCALEDRAVSMSILGAFAVPKVSNFNYNQIRILMPKRILPQTTISRQGRLKEEKVPKRLPKGLLEGVVDDTFSSKLPVFANLGPTLAPKSPKARLLLHVQ